MQTRTLCLAVALLAAGPAVLAQPPAVVPAPTPAQAYTLRYKFKTGDTNYYKLVMDTNGTIGGGPGGQAFPLKQHMEFVYHQTVTGVSATDGAATLVTKFDTLAMTMNGQPLPNADTMAEQFKARSFTTTVSPTGKTTAMKANRPDSSPMPGMDFSKMANFQGSAGLPDAPVKIGDKWDGSINMSNMLGPQMTGAQAKVASTLATVDTSAGKTIASIDQNITATFDSSSMPGPAAGMSLAGGMTGSGTMRFDTDAGLLIGQTSNSTLDTTLTQKGNAGAGAGLPGPMKLHFQISTDLEKVTAAAATAATTLPPAPGA